MGLYEELSQTYPLELVEPYGQVLIVPSKAFRMEWQSRLESEGVKVYSGAHGSQACFFLKALKSAAQAKPLEEEAAQPISQVKPSKFQPTWTREEEEALLKLKGEGLNFTEIGKRLGKSKEACYAKWKRLAKTSIKPPKPETQDLEGEADTVQEFIEALNMLYPKHKRICLFLIKHANEVVASDREQG